MISNMKHSKSNIQKESISSFKKHRTLSQRTDLDLDELSKTKGVKKTLNTGKSLTTNRTFNRHSYTKSELEKIFKESPRTCYYQTLKPSRLKILQDKQEPVESIKAISQKKQSLNSLYNLRLLPSQFLVTPINVLDKLKESLYTYRNTKADKSEFGASPKLKLGSKSRSIKHCFTNTTEFDSILKDSCDKILQDNKKSRKSLVAASKYLRRKNLLKSILVNSEVSNEGTEFKKRLKDAHMHLKSLDMIAGKHSHKISE